MTLNKQGGPAEWPQRNTDLNPYVFISWRWTKREVYRSRPRTRKELEQNLRYVGAVPLNFLTKSAVGRVSCRLEACGQIDGS
jgi:hypothetical protein